jgi:prolyl-tRNA synthetase
MAHSDDQGLVLPPKLAPIQVVIVPIYKGEDQLNAIIEKVNPLVKSLRKHGVSVKFDTSDNQSPGFKFAEYELKGVPVRLAIGNRDMENGTIELARRDTREKTSMPFDGIEQVVLDTLEDIQAKIYAKALAFRQEKTHVVNTWDEFTAKLDEGGFISAHWDGSSETEEKIKELTKATIRCIPLDAKEEPGKCILTGNPSSKRVLFARAY